MTIFAENKWRSDMTKEELIERLDDIEWEDFEVKSARNELPKNNTLRSGSKMNHPILPVSKKYSIDGKTVLAFYISSSPFKPVWFNSITNTFIRSGSGDRRASEMEQRDYIFHRDILSETVREYGARRHGGYR